MRTRMIFPLLFGLSGVGVLLWLGFWQLQRLEQKELVLGEVERRMAQAPAAVPDKPDFAVHNYLQVAVRGELVGAEAHVLTSEKFVGPGFLIISRLRLLHGREVLVDLGFVPNARKDEARPLGAVEITGNLLWPNEVDARFTPDPDLDKNIWFARDLGAMAAHLGTEPLMIVASGIKPAQENMPKPVRVASNIPNDHLEYAITWFSMALVWAGMTLYLLWRIRQRTV